MTSTSATSSPSQIHQNVVPSEVGWQFVPQYYTFVNKQPNRLHCFYTKTSTFIHGTEGEDVKACFGQQEIHNKITSLGFDDCKVYIHSVDAQSSANGGIIIQVIGEMSNHGDPWRKFVQTFFLAEQPNGYFVLNDIFRFLKEETVEDDASEPEASSTAPSEPAPESVREPTPPPPASEPEVEEPTTMVPEPISPPPEPEPALVEVNGVHHEPEPQPEPVSEPSTPEAEPEPAPAALVVPPQAPAPPPLVAPPPAPAPPTLVTPPPAPAQAPAPQPPAPAPKPAAPKTWASLAAADSKRWGAQVATESKGMSEVPASAAFPAPAQVPSGGASSPNPRREHSAIATANALTTPQCFVKGVTEVVSQQQLMDVEIVRSKACAFLEFNSLDAAKKAIIASLPTNVGGEGGLRLDGPEGSIRIVVETRKERADRPISRPRGGAPNGEARGGSFRGRGGSRGGRGGPPPPKQ
ncbi:uncharacterized protein EDB91DRAFT_1098529 [Suillus paluster]|uniref:uncharacterized protein n=1 Tax=Suillus paluster TaxID=48578 RepID=UPI001B87AC5F|nr:uncharacterized protein EDB91DRAFT_1098529 [Suillus paluster]KAG1753538.1 hypothetical protein EDB91DRAFT_1098529 [Suillus paluster]